MRLSIDAPFIAGTAVIYASLPWARRLNAGLTDAFGRDSALWLTVIVVGSAFVLGLARIAARRPPGAALRLAGAAGAALGGWALLIYTKSQPAETIHLLEYGLLAWAALRSAESRLGRPAAWFLALGLLLLAGAGDEVIQYILPGRVGEVRDVLINLAAGLVGLVFWISVGSGGDKGPSLAANA